MERDTNCRSIKTPYQFQPQSIDQVLYVYGKQLQTGGSFFVDLSLTTQFRLFLLYFTHHTFSIQAKPLTMPTSTRRSDKLSSSLAEVMVRSQHKFDTKSLPADMQRVFKKLSAKHGEEYALTFIFIMRTAIELHRAWHMSLLTNKILQQVKDKFDLAMTWELGVFKIKFRVDDGSFELHRKVPYDYDSEYQNIYMKIAVALGEGSITVDEALTYQTETKKGLHTAKSGLFLRDFPGRLVIYPLLSMSCAVIFFGGDWADGGVAAICGIACGLTEWFIAEGVGGEAKILIDVVIGTITGAIGCLFYQYESPTYCLSAIFLGNLYWYFYGTAFVVGLLEIIAGELETGVTRFIAVSVKTFVLCLGAGFGMILVLPSAETSPIWEAQNENCGTIDLGNEAWRIPLYLLSSAAALGQYRFPIVGYWRGLAVQLAGYEAQFQLQAFLEQSHTRNNVDTASSNVVGAAAAVVTACAISYALDQVRYYYYGKLLKKDEGYGTWANLCYTIASGLTSFTVAIGIGRKADKEAQELEKKISIQSKELADPAHPRGALELEEKEQKMVVDILIDSQDHNIWAVLMPAVYQLVPGSIIARLWFNSLFPPPLIEESVAIPGQNFTLTTYQLDANQENVFSALMVVSASLALGLILGFALVSFFEFIFCRCADDTITDIYGGGGGKRSRARDRRAGMYTAEDDDPTDDDDAIKAPAVKEVKESEESNAVVDA